MPHFQIEWNGIPHTEVALPQSNSSWKFKKGDNFGAMLFQMVETARQMGMTLTDFMELPEDEKAIQLTVTGIKAKMEAVTADERARKAQQKPRGK